MPLFRCLNCHAEFESARPACEACGVGADGDPRTADQIVKLETIHFDPPTAVAGRGKGVAACDAKLRVGARGCGFTGEPDVVNCAACKKTEAYTAAGGVSAGAVPMPTKTREKK